MKHIRHSFKLKAFAFSVAVFILFNKNLFSQSVGVNYTGALANSSALLDVDAGTGTKKGILIPRVALTSSTDASTISNPAASLLVYNLGTGGLSPASYYWNSGTSASPVWVPFLNGGSSATGWMLSGNSGTVAANFLGTTDNKSLRIRTNNTQKMIIDSLGKVGIGTNAPGADLEVVKNGNAEFRIIGYGSNGSIRSYASGGTSTSPTAIATGGYRILNIGGIGYNGSAFSGEQAQIAFNAGQAWTTTAEGAYITFGTTYNDSTSRRERMKIDHNGNVGIGQTSPLYKLHVSTTSAWSAKFSSSAAANGGIYIDAASGYNANIALQQGGTDKWYLGNRASDDRFSWINAGGSTEVMSILQGGNVGIGTNAPAELLHVQKDQNNKTRISLKNMTDNTSATAEYMVTRSDSKTATFGLGNSAYSSTDFRAAYIWTNSPQGIALRSDDASGPIRFLTNSTEYMRVDANGKVGIGCSSPVYNLDVRGTLGVSGQITTASAVVTSGVASCSDVRFKKDIVPLQNALSNVLKLQGVNYLWRKDEFPKKDFTDGVQIGFIAQEIEKIYPQMVMTGADGYKSVDYSRLTPVLVEALKELNAKNEAQQKIINDQQLTISKALARLDKVEALLGASSKDVQGKR